MRSKMHMHSLSRLAVAQIFSFTNLTDPIACIQMASLFFYKLNIKYKSQMHGGIHYVKCIVDSLMWHC
jgi:hypothetical protein